MRCRAPVARLEHIVGLTQWLASPSHPSLMARQHWLVDRLFSMMPGVAHTIVNPGFFADAYFATMGAAVHFGVFPGCSGIVATRLRRMKISPVSPPRPSRILRGMLGSATGQRDQHF